MVQWHVVLKRCKGFFAGLAAAGMLAATCMAADAAPADQQMQSPSGAVAQPAAPAANPPAVNAAPAPQKQQRPSQVHTVWLWQESRDCLWNLAKKYYGDPWQWKKIYLANRHQIENPGIIYPKQVLVIPPADEPER